MGSLARKLMDGAAAASFPVYESLTATLVDGTTVTSHSINMPATVNAGDLLVALIASGSNACTWSTAASGWSAGELVDVQKCAVYYKIADGSEGGTSVTFTSSASVNSATQVIRVSNWHGTTPPEVAEVNSASSTTTPDPPSLSPSWGSAKTLWIAVALMERSDRTVSSWFSSYTSNQTTTLSGSATKGAAYSASRELEAASENPGAITVSGNSNEYVAVTIAVRPA